MKLSLSDDDVTICEALHVPLDNLTQKAHTERMKITRDAQKVIDAAIAVGGRPLIVGGAVRDHLLSIPSKDIDIEVHGVESLDEIGRILGGVDEVGKSFGVLKFHEVDISLPRRDSKVSDGHTGFTVEFDPEITITEALSRRDFTINAMAFDPVTQELIDPFGGRIDLREGTLRHTSEAFAEDPLRVLRGVQFAARFGFRIHPDTAKFCRTLTDSFSELSIERVWGEWEKILTKGASFFHALRALEMTGWIRHFPEFAEADVDRVDRWIGQDPATLVTTMFRGGNAQEFLWSIGAPLAISRKVNALLTPQANLPVRRILRLLGTQATIEEFDIVWGTDHAAEANRLGLTGLVPLIITGDTLIQWGMKPGPAFGEILRTFEVAQDWSEFTDETTAIAWAQRNASFLLDFGLLL